ncbi:MAG: PorT family protein [Ignavibacteriae bacterium]|nr:PorT family protein [Ignavibacteriota bacterium]
MRLLTCVLVLACIPMFHADAQISIACQGGLNFANLSDPGNLAPTAVWSTQLGFVGLVSANFPIGAGFSVSPGFRFVQKGTRSDWFLSPYGTFAINMYHSYIELPVYVKYALIDSRVRLSLLMGPSLGHLVSSRAKGTITSEGNVSFDVTEDYRSYDCSIDAGLECETPISETFSIVGSAAYSLGLVKIYKMGGNERTRDIRVMVGIGYSFI